MYCCTEVFTIFQHSVLQKLQYTLNNVQLIQIKLCSHKSKTIKEPDWAYKIQTQVLTGQYLNRIKYNVIQYGSCGWMLYNTILLQIKMLVNRASLQHGP